MFRPLRGIEAIVVLLFIVALLIVVLVLGVQLILLLLPLAIIVFVLSYLFRFLRRIKVGKDKRHSKSVEKNYINVDYKVKK